MSCANSAILHRSLEKTYPTAATGSGVYILTDDGRKILDGSSGAAVSSLGHGNTEIIDAICAQARQLAFAHTSFFTSDPAEELARLIIQRSGNDAFSKVVWLTSGSEAVESAIKMARQYHVFNGEDERVHIIGRVDSYHGNTLGALGAGNNPARRKVCEPLLSSAFQHVSRCFYHADGKPLGLTEVQYEDKLLAEYQETFERLGPRTIAAVILEPVGGATLGSVPPTSHYLSRLSDLCARHGVLTIYDEVMCGMGRIGSYHAWQSFEGPPPDLQSIGKGLGAGYQPLSAVLVGPRVRKMFEECSKGERTWVSGHTFQGHSIGCAAALMAQTILFRDGLIDNCRAMGELLSSTLEAEMPPAFLEHGGSLRGLGLFRSVDFGNIGEKPGRFAKTVADKAFELGAAVYTCSTQVDAVLLCPPFILTKTETLDLARIVVQAFKAVLSARMAAVEGQ